VEKEFLSVGRPVLSFYGFLLRVWIRILPAFSTVIVATTFYGMHLFVKGGLLKGRIIFYA